MERSRVRGGGAGGWGWRWGAVVVRPLELQRRFQVGSSKRVCTGSVIPEPPAHTCYHLRNNKGVLVLSQLTTGNKDEGKTSYIHIQDGWVRNGAPAELLIVTLM